ncbi:hypothetical protein CWI48_05540, partial [Neisseria meningitidis]
RWFCYAGWVDWSGAEELSPLWGRLHVGEDVEAFVAEVVKSAGAGGQMLVVGEGGCGGMRGELLDALWWPGRCLLKALQAVCSG